MSRADNPPHGRSGLPDRPVVAWPRPLAFVLSGGGTFGAAQVGMLQALEESSIRPDMIVGTSVGALNGAMVAARPDGSAERLASGWRSLSRRRLLLSAIRHTARAGFRPMLRAALNLLRPRRASLFGSSLIEALIDGWLEVDAFEQLEVPLRVIVTETVSGAPVALTSGPIKPALIASAAVPAVFPPVELDERLYVDGGISANVPVRQAIDAGAASVVVLNANPAEFSGRPPTTMVGSVLHASAVLLRSQEPEGGDEVPGVPVMRLPQVTPSSFSSFSFRHTAELIDMGRRRSLEALDELDALDSPRRDQK